MDNNPKMDSLPVLHAILLLVCEVVHLAFNIFGMSLKVRTGNLGCNFFP